MGLAYAQKAFQHTRFRRPDLDWAAAERDARRAIELDPELGLGYAGLALVHEQHGREGEARNAFMMALQFSPGDSRILMEFAILNSYAGDHDQAVRLAEEAVQSDPNSAATHHRLARRLTLAGRLNEAGIPRRNAVRLSGNPGFRGELVRLEVARGHDRVALEELLIVEELTTEPSLRDSIQLAYAFSRLGRSQDAEDYLRQFRMRSEDEELDPGTVTTAHLAAGDPDQAFEVLRMHVESGDPAAGLQFDIVDIRSNWWRDPILDEPRFRALRERIVFFPYE